MKEKKMVVLLSVFLIAIIPIACTMFVGGPEYPVEQIAISTEAVGQLENQLEIAKTAAVENGILSITINEKQITSLLALKLADLSDPIIQNPQVFLRNGEIQLYGKASQGNLQANIRIILAASLNSDGKMIVNVSSADFGPFPAPDGLNNTISALIDQSFTGAFGPAITGLRLENITIENGTMNLTGRIK